jgi:ribosomal protein S18 acetylase RimI-like enzyme
MFHEMGYGDTEALDVMSARFRPWLLRKMESGEYLGWFALTADSSIAAGLGLWLMNWPPHLVSVGRWRGNILNVYTEAAQRRIGIARGLMAIALDWCAAHDVDAVILHASAEGRGLYESLGFEATNENAVGSARRVAGCHYCADRRAGQRIYH